MFPEQEPERSFHGIGSKRRVLMLTTLLKNIAEAFIERKGLYMNIDKIKIFFCYILLADFGAKKRIDNIQLADN